jgi:sugar phosphate isomerase/epimerase
MIGPSNLMKPSSKMGIQLYTLRDQIGANPGAVLEKIAAAGYKNVELYGYAKGQFFGKSVKEFGQLLKDNHLKSPSGHYSLENYLSTERNEDDVKELIDVAHTLNQEYIVIPYLQEEHRKTIDQYKKLAARMNKAGEVCKAAGLTLGYHNHNFEFMKLEGGTGYDVILTETDPSLVKLEMDIYWVVRSGMDPIAMMTKYPGRFPMWHVKDMSKTNPEENTEIGNGTIDFKKIFESAKLSGLKYYYLEQENNYVPDPFGSIIKSADYISKNLV